jgi:hypothetical protein
MTTVRVFPKAFACLWALALGLAPIGTQSKPAKGDKEFQLSGNGTSDKDFTHTIFGASGSYGWFLTDSQEIGIHQSIHLAELENTQTRWHAATRAFYDWHFDLDTVQPFVGASLGYAYGRAVDESLITGPEVGMKFYVKPKVFIVLQTEYQFFFAGSGQANDAFDDGSLVYSLGIGFHR